MTENSVCGAQSARMDYVTHKRVVVSMKVHVVLAAADLHVEIVTLHMRTYKVCVFI